MSLVIRRVKEISKKRNRKPRKWYVLEPFDDNPSKLLIDEEYGEEQDSLPSLNSVYRKTIVGTPILFRRISGWEYQDAHSDNVNFQSIIFMKEYHKKSHEELRWEDYLSNRKGNHYIHQETNFPRIVTNYNFSISDNFEFFHPLPRNILKHLDLGRTLEPYSNEIISSKHKVQNLFIGNSIERNQRTFSTNNETNFWHLQKAKMSNEKIKSFFAKSDFSIDSSQSVPNIMFFLPCRNLEPNLLKPRSKKRDPKSFGDFTVGTKMEIRKYKDGYYFNKSFLQNRQHPYLMNQYKNNKIKKLGRFTVTSIRQGSYFV